MLLQYHQKLIFVCNFSTFDYFRCYIIWIFSDSGSGTKFIRGIISRNATLKLLSLSEQYH